MSLEKLAALRASVAAVRRPVTEPKLGAYLENVGSRAWAITDEEVAGVLAAGVSQDDVFESTIVAALDAAIERYEAGLRALEKA